MTAVESSDLELIQYCEQHCKSPRALFNGAQINRMLALAGHPASFVRQVDERCWLSVHEPMSELCQLARERLQQEAIGVTGGCAAKRPKVYLAGPDVFSREPLAVGERLKTKCRAAGLEPLYPMDNQVPAGTVDVARCINDGNVAMIRQADLVIANLNPFRGPEPDSGTVFECGLACGLGKPVVGYLASAESLADRVIRMQGLPASPRPAVDRDGLQLEDFGHPLNLMLVYGVSRLVVGTFEDALAVALELWSAPVAKP